MYELTGSEKGFIDSLNEGDTFTCERRFLGKGKFEKSTYRIKSKIGSTIIAKTDDNNCEIKFVNGVINNLHDYKNIKK